MQTPSTLRITIEEASLSEGTGTFSFDGAIRLGPQTLLPGDVREVAPGVWVQVTPCDMCGGKGHHPRPAGQTADMEGEYTCTTCKGRGFLWPEGIESLRRFLRDRLPTEVFNEVVKH